MAKSKVAESLMDILEILLIGITVFTLVYLFVGQLLEVSGESMTPTFQDKEQIIAEKISLSFKPLKHGEIVIFKHPETPEKLLIKRVIALSGDKIMLENGKIVLNGTVLFEPYLEKDMKTEGGKAIEENKEYTVPGMSYVLMGDNRLESSDSRVFGAVKENMIIGRTLLVYSPLKNFRIIEH